ncbi:hypothetical protein LCGC14_2709510 [marine sediment metagenome]|uniref:Uncharacterized protein n=1 Tax=marine sediment metagenome TaxID=412755 RepID=A0A0F9A107_9ZZZZ
MPDGHGIDQASQRATGAAERSAQGGGGGGDFVNKVILPTDQDSARLLFLTLNEDVYSGKFHRVPSVAKSGKQFWESIACGTEVGRSCAQCASQAQVEAQDQFLFWVFLRYYDFTTTGEKRQQVQVGNAIRYRETVNQVRLFQYAISHLTVLTTMASRLGPLAFETEGNQQAGRDWDWVRNGVRGSTSTTYSLIPVNDPTVLPADLDTLAADLPDLEKVAFNEVRHCPQLGGAPTPTVVQVPAAEGVATAPTTTPSTGAIAGIDQL